MFCFAQPRTRDNIRIQRTLLSELRLFQEKPELVAAGRYTIRSDVDPEVVDLFFGRVGGEMAECVTSENAEQLRALCDELGFSGFDDEIRAVLGGNLKVRKDLLGLRTRVDRHDSIIEELQRRVFEVERRLREQREVPQRVEAVERRVEEIRRNDVERAIAEAKREASQALQRGLERTESALALMCKLAYAEGSGRDASGTFFTTACRRRKDAFSRLFRTVRSSRSPSGRTQGYAMMPRFRLVLLAALCLALLSSGCALLEKQRLPSRGRDEVSLWVSGLSHLTPLEQGRLAEAMSKNATASPAMKSRALSLAASRPGPQGEPGA